MKDEQLSQLLTQMAGKNALGTNDANILHLCQCVNYLAIQLKIRTDASIFEDDEKSISGIFDEAISILEGR